MPATALISARYFSSQRDRALVLDCLRVRDLGGAWLDHESFGLVEDHDAARSSLVRDGLAFWDEFGLEITPRGRRAWADARRALRDIEVELPAPAPLPSLTSALARRAAVFGEFDGVAA